MITLYGRKRRETKEPLDECEKKSIRADLKLNIQKTKIMVSGPIMSRQIETMSTVTYFIFLGFKITADGDCSMKLKDTCSLEGKL